MPNRLHRTAVFRKTSEAVRAPAAAAWIHAWERTKNNLTATLAEEWRGLQTSSGESSAKACWLALAGPGFFLLRADCFASHQK